MSQTLKTEWTVVTVEPSRLQSGLWGYTEGDIYASYSGDTYGMAQKIRGAFKHSAVPHVAMSTASNYRQMEAKAYPLVHASYADDIMAEYRASGLSDYYTGKAVRYQRNDCIFGLPKIFQQRRYTADELIDLTRRMYAYGGMFASEAGTYDAFVLGQIKKMTLGSYRKALLAEAEQSGLPQTQVAMRQLIETLMRRECEPVEADQLALF